MTETLVSNPDAIAATWQRRANEDLAPAPFVKSSPYEGETVLTQVADGVWVRQSEWVWTNSTVVQAEDGLILVDPGIHGSELNELADDLDRLGIPVVAGFSTHPHTDHLLWHSRFGDVPRYATAAGAKLAAETREQQLEGPEEEGWSDVPLELIALVTPLPADGGPVPGEIIEHQHTPSATPRSSSRTVVSCSPATCSPMS